MRASPVAYWYDDINNVLEAAKRTAECTHNHPEGIKGAQTVALAIKTALDFNRLNLQNATSHVDDIINECVAFSGYDINIPIESVQNKFDETCHREMAVICYYLLNNPTKIAKFRVF